MNSTVAGLCRLSIRAPGKSFDLAVPADVPLADLLPTIVGYAGDDLDEAGLDHGGWVLQDLGDAPLDEEATPEVLGLRDGQVLYLRSRQDSLPAVHFDDIVDGIGTGLRDRPGAWHPAATKWLLHGMALVAAAFAWAGILLSGPTLPRTAAAIVVALLLLAAAGSASRAVGDAVAGTLYGVAAVPLFALAGLLVPGPSATPAALLLASATAAAGGVVLALVASGTHPQVHLGVLVVCVFGVLTAGIMLAAGELASAFAVTAVLAVIFGAFVPGLAFRLAGLKMPPLPTNADQLQEGIDPLPSKTVLDRGAVADQYLVALFLATGAVCAAAITGLLTAPGWAPVVTAGVLSVLLLLHGREVGGIRTRLAVVLPGAYGLAALAITQAVHLALPGRLLLVVGVLLAGAALMVAGWTVPGRRMVPYWGRIADVVHVLFAVALLPLTLLVLGVFGFLRAING
ncbi:type VII secretion integral membrane protein EccD [Amycolatopsis sp. NPDC059021]|uniref:type VII secretion integral membrane protein EccD n=1 Tax=Amycolatopsis sp. NPDC059021 TaxID=3346704 RepID=UPI00366DE8B9